MWRGLVAPLKHLKVYIKIVKQQLGVSGFFGKGRAFLLGCCSTIKKWEGHASEAVVGLSSRSLSSLSPRRPSSVMSVSSSVSLIEL